MFIFKNQYMDCKAFLRDYTRRIKYYLLVGVFLVFVL